MDEKEMISKIKNSLKKGISRIEITKRLQQQGYKLEYIDLMISKATRKKKFFIWSLIVILLSIIFAFATLNSSEEQNFFNPLKDKIINYGEEKIGSESSNDNGSSENPGENSININDIEITPDLINYLLQEIGASDLHKNYLTGEKAIINFEIGDKKFNSVIDKKIQTNKATNSKADMVFISDKKSMVRALTADNVKTEVKKAIESGDIEMSVKASESELFAKGYLSLYNSLK